MSHFLHVRKTYPEDSEPFWLSVIGYWLLVYDTDNGYTDNHSPKKVRREICFVIFGYS